VTDDLEVARTFLAALAEAAKAGDDETFSRFRDRRRQRGKREARRRRERR